MDTLKITNLLESALAEVRQGDPSTAPAGMVAVVPAGPEGRGKVRYWPEVLAEDSNVWSYAIRVSKMPNPATKAPFFPPEKTSTPLGYLIPAFDFVPTHSFPTICDYITHERDWCPQWMLDREAGAQTRSGFSPQR